MVVGVGSRRDQKRQRHEQFPPPWHSPPIEQHNTAVRTANLLRNTARCCVSGGGRPPAKVLALWLARLHSVQNNSLLVPCYAACSILHFRRCSRLVCWTRCASGFVICATAYVPSRPTSIGFGPCASPGHAPSARDGARRGRGIFGVSVVGYALALAKSGGGIVNKNARIRCEPLERQAPGRVNTQQSLRTIRQRYADDMIILVKSKRAAQRDMRSITRYLETSSCTRCWTCAARSRASFTSATARCTRSTCWTC